MRQTGIPQPITTYAIPPGAPEPVAEAFAEYQRVAILYEDAYDDLRDAREALAAAQAADVRAIVDATSAGEEPKDPQANERKAQAEVERLTTLRKGYSVAVDEAGSELARQIEQHKDEWSGNLTGQASEMAEAFDAALAEARIALAAFVPAQAGVKWVENFTAREAQVGRYSQFTGGRVRVSGRWAGVSELPREYDPATLLKVAALATAAPPYQPATEAEPKVVVSRV